MGTPVPTVPPPIDPDEWYGVHVDVYWNVHGFDGCTDDYDHSDTCCVSGVALTAWYFWDKECGIVELCRFAGQSAQRLLHVHGPYSSKVSCEAEL